MKNEMTEGMVYSEEMEQWVDIAEWLQHVRSVANTLIPGFQYDYRWTSCSSTDTNGNTTRWTEPYIRVAMQAHGEAMVELLNGEGIFAELDLYEDEDGDGEYGRPIIRKIWSVRLPGIRLDSEISI
tara:strand:+ start:898 stop:1275 length:378 start_codon:yes stop_codon:yes gene_type:complete